VTVAAVRCKKALCQVQLMAATASSQGVTIDREPTSADLAVCPANAVAAKHWNLGVGNGRACGAARFGRSSVECTVVAFWRKRDTRGGLEFERHEC
jgi:hypothetical protein